MASIYAVGHFVPPNVVSNDDLSKWMDTSDEWISQRTGIRERRWIRRGNESFVGMSNAEMARSAVTQALASRDIKPGEIDAIIYATVSPDTDSPGSGVGLKELLDIDSAIPVIEVRNQCSGFMYGLLIAKALVDDGLNRRVLVVGSEIQSSGLDLLTEGRGTTVLFADGCGVVLVVPDTDAAAKVLDVSLCSDGRFADRLGVKRPGFCSEAILEPALVSGGNQEIYPHMDGRMIFHMASEKMPHAVRSILERNGYSASDLAAVIPHQANQRIIDMLGRDLGPEIKVFSNIARYGNTTAASIPIALSEAVRADYVHRGDLICLVTFGSGVSWGAALIKWGS
ncbi:MAG: beta-ketoacyl-ACP synthase 3 [Deltaproteobacteria bacterium]|nr:beta-ketoacyl-ACP synthase 3 [Deltaproteobacteria bacterium]